MPSRGGHCITVSPVQQKDHGKGHTTVIRLYGLNYWVISGACSLNYAVKMAIWERTSWNKPWLSLRHMIVEYYKPTDGSCCLLGTSTETRSFILSDTVVDREEARILISHTTAIWVGLVKVLCKNKAPPIKRQVASVSKKAKEPSDQNNNNYLSGLQHILLQHPPKEKYSQVVMVKQLQDVSPASQPRSHRRCCRGKPAHREVDAQLDHQSVKSHSFQADGW